TATAIPVVAYTPASAVPAGCPVYLVKLQDLDNATRAGFIVDNGVALFGTPGTQRATTEGEAQFAEKVFVDKSLTLTQISAPGGTASLTTLYAGSDGELYVYIGTSGPFRVVRLGGDGKIA